MIQDGQSGADCDDVHEEADALSSILEALKKVEKEAPSLDFTPEVTKAVDTRKAVSRRARGSRVLYRLMWSLAIAAVLCGGIWFAYSGKNLFFKTALRNQPAPVEKPSMKASSDSTAFVATPDRPAPSQIEKPQDGTSPASARPAQIDQDPPVTAALNGSRPEPAMDKSLESPPRGLPQAPEAQKPRLRKQSLHELNPVGEEESPSSRHAPQPQAEYNPEDAKYKLEAIVWAERPENRFAVINGQIVRIGGTMEGLSVISIDRDYVAVRSSGREWRMKFVMD